MDLQTTLDRAMLKGAVARQITCKVSGELLDVRTAVEVTVKFPSGNVSTLVLKGTEWDAMADRFTANVGDKFTSVTVLDGRKLYGRQRASQAC